MKGATVSKRRWRWSRVAGGAAFILWGVVFVGNFVPAMIRLGVRGILNNRSELAYCVSPIAGIVLTGIWYSMLGAPRLRSARAVLGGTLCMFAASALFVSGVFLVVAAEGGDLLLLGNMIGFALFIGLAHWLTFPGAWPRVAARAAFLFWGQVLVLNLVAVLIDVGVRGILNNRTALAYCISPVAGIVLTGIWYSMLGAPRLRSARAVLAGTLCMFVASALLAGGIFAVVAYERGGFAFGSTIGFALFIGPAYLLTFPGESQAAAGPATPASPPEPPENGKPKEQRAVEKLRAHLRQDSGWDADMEQVATQAARAMLTAGRTDREVLFVLTGLGISRKGAKKLIGTAKSQGDCGRAEEQADAKGDAGFPAS